MARLKDRYNDEIRAAMPNTTWTTGCKSWYIDRNGLNTSLWPDFSFRFKRALSRFDPSEYLVYAPVPAAPEPVVGVPGDDAAATV